MRAEESARGHCGENTSSIKRGTLEVHFAAVDQIGADGAVVDALTIIYASHRATRTLMSSL